MSEEEKVLEERVYTVPLKIKGRGLHRAKKAVKILKEFISRHMHSENVKIMTEVNEKIWSRGIRNPPRRIKVKAVRTEENVVKVYLFE